MLLISLFQALWCASSIAFQAGICVAILIWNDIFGTGAYAQRSIAPSPKVVLSI
jgi:hypothetical protein